MKLPISLEKSTVGTRKFDALFFLYHFYECDNDLVICIFYFKLNENRKDPPKNNIEFQKWFH